MVYWPLPVVAGVSQSTFIFVRQFTQVARLVYFIPKQFLHILTSERDADMPRTTQVFISEHYTERIKGFMIEPHDKVPYGTFLSFKIYISRDRAF